MTSPAQLLAPFLRELRRYASLTAEDEAVLLKLPARLRRVDAGSYIVREGETPEHCCILVEGFVVRQKLTGDGSRQIIAVCIPGDPVDFQNMFLDISDHSVMALTRAVVADVPREAIQAVIRDHGNVSTAIMQATLVESSILREWVVNVGRRDARARIAHILCEFAVRLEARGLASEHGFELPMTQEQLADATGLTPVHVNRVLKALEKEGLIERQRRKVQFVDWRALQDAGDFSRGYLHMAPEDHIPFAA